VAAVDLAFDHAHASNVTLARSELHAGFFMKEFRLQCKTPFAERL
jgi:hypothetical protein